MRRFGAFGHVGNLLPASFRTRSTSALAGDVVVVSKVVSVVAVPGTETAVLVLCCTSGAHSASVYAGLTRVRSATDCVVSLDVVSWLGAAAVVAVSGSSGRLKCSFGIGLIKMGSRSL